MASTFHVVGALLLAAQLHLVLAAHTAREPAIPSLSSIHSLRDEGIIDYTRHPELRTKPRAVLGYVSDKEWALIEFLCMMHASWRLLTALPTPQPLKLDLWVFVHPRYAAQAASICHQVNLDDGRSLASQWEDSTSQCFAVVVPPPDPQVWHGYPFINNVHFLQHPWVVRTLTQRYGLVMKTDFDTFLAPTLLHFWPDRFTFGVQEYVVMPETAARLSSVAQRLHLKPVIQHNLGPTWYGEVGTLLRLAAASVPIMHHLITKEFEQLPGGGIKQKYLQGEGWPEWCAGIAALYATELAANHLLGHFDATTKMDQHAGSEGLVAGVYHLHARHDDHYFSKFEFFRHHYDAVNISGLNQAVICDYCTFLAATTWRELVQLQQLQQQQQQQRLLQQTQLPMVGAGHGSEL